MVENFFEPEVVLLNKMEVYLFYFSEHFKKIENPTSIKNDSKLILNFLFQSNIQKILR